MLVGRHVDGAYSNRLSALLGGGLCVVGQGLLVEVEEPLLLLGIEVHEADAHARIRLEVGPDVLADDLDGDLECAAALFDVDLELEARADREGVLGGDEEPAPRDVLRY